MYDVKGEEGILIFKIEKSDDDYEISFVRIRVPKCKMLKATKPAKVKDKQL